MSFSKTAKYRTADFDQEQELEPRAMDALNGYSSLAQGLDDQTRFGVCLALCIIWINNKVLTKKKRVKGAENRMNQLFKRQFVHAIDLQKLAIKSWKTHSGNLGKIFADSDVDAPRPVTIVNEEGRALDTATVLVATLPLKVPYIMIYRWSPTRSHAIVCYRTTNRTMIVDPNCGELACQHEDIADMWKDYWKDVAAAFKTVPGTYGLAALGVDPDNLPVTQKKGRRCLLATASCENVGLADDCEELLLLRHYRDTVLARTSAGRGAIDRYYRLAPAVLARVHADPRRERILRGIYEQTVVPASDAIRAGRTDEAQRIFLALLKTMTAAASL